MSNFSKLFRQTWLKRLALVVMVAVLVASIGSPSIARSRRYPPYAYALFQPSAYRSYPYRDSQSSIAATLSREGRFKNLVAELKEAGLLDTLDKSSTKLTIFAPTDAAFERLSQANYQRYSNNRAKVLKYHVVSGQINEDTIDKGTISTLEGQPIQVTADQNGAVKLNQVEGKRPAIVAMNGVIIEVDQVLLPPDF